MLIFSSDDILRIKIAVKCYHIYCDMDEVLTSFEEYFKINSGMYCQPFIEKYGEEAFWSLVVSDKNWFLNLPIKEDAYQLWDFIKEFNPTILTTPGGNIERCKKQKRQWINKGSRSRSL